MAIQAYQADLHIHTVLSPCAEVEMIPSLIVVSALQSGLDIIAIADHNSCENAGAVIEAAEGTGLKVLPGMEVQSVEGVHFLCLFDSLDSANEMQETVYASLPKITGARKVIDEQLIVDSNDEFIRYCEKPISLPTSMDVDEVYERVNRLNGIIIPSHIDRQSTGMCGVLGMMPETPVFDAVEISANLTADQARIEYSSIGDRPIFQNSDAHWLSLIGEKRTLLYLEHRSIAEIRMACHQENGRRVCNA